MPLVPIPEPRASGLIRATSVPLYWAAYGPSGASPLLVLHGGPGADHRYLLPQMLRLAEEHDLLLYDQRGGGRSPVTDSDGPVTWRVDVEDLGAVIQDRLGGNPPTIVGYSWGGLLALLYLIETAREGGDEEGQGFPPPERLVLISPAPVSKGYRAVFEREFSRRQAATVAPRAALAESGLRERDPQAYRQRAFELSVTGYFADPALARDLTPFRVTARTQQSVWDSLGSFDLLPPLAALAARAGMPPTIIVHGRQDPIPVASSEALAEATGSELVVLDKCGHVPYVEQPERLFQAVSTFLAATARAGEGGGGRGE
jgi:proline iminopeptidase